MPAAAAPRPAVHAARRCLLACALIAAASLGLRAGALAQAPIGLADRLLPNATGKGTKQIWTSIVYPATRAGRDAPVRKRAGGRACAVLLHGFGRLGAEYYRLALHLAENGFIVFLPNTGQFSIDTLHADGLALPSAIARVNREQGHLLEGAIDTARVGLIGHSYGGMIAGRILARNSGYHAGLAIAPIYENAKIGNARMPFGVLHGVRDSVVDWGHGFALYRAATSYRELKFFAQFDARASHLNVAGMELSTDADRWIWDRSARMIGGFLLRFLDDRVAALESVIGASVRRDARIARLDLEIDAPQLWRDGAIAYGRPFATTIAAEPGPFVLLFGWRRASLPTPFGLLGLDPSALVPLVTNSIGVSKLGVLTLATPNDARLTGFEIGLQALATRARRGLRLSPIDYAKIEKR